jgi:hypothetical protein
LQSAQASVLHDVLGRCRIAYHPTREIIRGIQVRQDCLLNAGPNLTVRCAGSIVTPYAAAQQPRGPETDKLDPQVLFHNHGTLHKRMQGAKIMVGSR